MEQEPKFDYFYGCQSEQYSFYRIPKVLFTNEYFRPLSCEAKVLYGLLLDRMALSMKNQWMDEQNPSVHGYHQHDPHPSRTQIPDESV